MEKEIFWGRVYRDAGTRALKNASNIFSEETKICLVKDGVEGEGVMGKIDRPLGGQKLKIFSAGRVSSELKFLAQKVRQKSDISDRRSKG